MGVPIGLCHECKNYKETVSVPCCDLFLTNNKGSTLNTKQDSIILPNDNNMNSYYESKINFNYVDEYSNTSLSPISKMKRVFFQSNVNNDSSNYIKNTSNIETNKVFDSLKYKKGTKFVKGRFFVKKESISQEGKNSNLRDNNLEEIIKEFDKQIKNYGTYISDEQFNNSQNEVIKEMESNLETFENNFKKSNNIFERPPFLFKKDNSKYKGFWNIKGEKSGFGIFIDSQGNKYIGQWEQNKFNGRGRILSINGDYYEGDLYKGLIEGEGFFYSKKDNYKYFGEFKENKFHGKGKIIYIEKQITYVGEFKDGYKHGFGKLIFPDNSYYEGNFENNNYNGNGKFRFSDGRTYNGQWKQNNIDGKGIFTWGEETKYNGYYKNNQREGTGVYSFGCNLYDGNWVNGMPHGEGTLLYDGLKVVGHFRYGKITDMTDWKGANKEMAERITLGSRVNLKYQLTYKETITDTDSKISKKEYQKQKTFGNKRDLMSKSSKDKKVKYIDKENSQKDKSKTKDKEKGKRKSILKKH